MKWKVSKSCYFKLTAINIVEAQNTPVFVKFSILHNINYSSKQIRLIIADYNNDNLYIKLAIKIVS